MQASLLHCKHGSELPAYLLFAVGSVVTQDGAAPAVPEKTEKKEAQRVII